jgi:hypothetical protein
MTILRDGGKLSRISESLQFLSTLVLKGREECTNREFNIVESGLWKLKNFREETKEGLCHLYFKSEDTMHIILVQWIQRHIKCTKWKNFHKDYKNYKPLLKGMDENFFKRRLVWKRHKNKPELIPGDKHCSRWEWCILHNFSGNCRNRRILSSSNHELRGSREGLPLRWPTYAEVRTVSDSQ